MRIQDNTKKEAVIRAAIELINEIGLAEVSNSKIAKRAGVSSSSIYVYFKNKEDMIYTIFTSILENVRQAVREGINPNDPVREILEHSLRNLITFHLENSYCLIFYDRIYNSNEKYRQHPVSAVNMGEFFDRGKSEGVIKQVDTRLLMYYYFTPATELFKAHVLEGFTFSDQIIDTLLWMSWEAIKA